MKVLIASPSFPSFTKKVHDGRFVYSEAVAYARAGASVKVVAPYFPGADCLENIYQNVTVYRFSYLYPRRLQRLRVPGVPIYKRKSFFSVIQIPFFCFFFALAIMRYGAWADVIHAQWTITALLALPTKWLYKKKLVMTARGTDIRSFPKWINQLIHYQVDAAIDCFGPQPRNQFYRKSFSGRFFRLPLLAHIETCDRMPRDMLKALKGRKNPFIILYVGRFDKFKLDYNKLPILDLIRAARLLKKEGLDFHVFYIGGGDEQIRENMEQLIRSEGVFDRVSLLGEKVNATDYMSFANLGIGGIAFNAVSQEFTLLGKPQILMELPDNTETPWKNNVNVIFVKPNDVNELAQKISWAIRNRKKIEEVGKTAKRMMTQYVMDSSLGGQVYLEAFRNL